jgi:hypothetical protein
VRRYFSLLAGNIYETKKFVVESELLLARDLIVYTTAKTTTFKLFRALEYSDVRRIAVSFREQTKNENYGINQPDLVLRC